MYSPTIDKLIKLLAKFPTVGPRTAARFVFYLIASPKSEVQQLVEAIAELKNKIKTCPSCCRTFEPLSNGEPKCAICSNPKRHNSQVCVVEKEVDLETIEKTNSFKGTYFVLGYKTEQGLEDELKILLARLQTENITEVILALNFTPEGQNTILWLKRKLEASKIKVSQLGQGMPLGAELEYADEQTIISALEGRK